MAEIEELKDEYIAIRDLNEQKKAKLNELIDKEKAYKLEITELRHKNNLLEKDLDILQNAKGTFTNSQNELL